MKPREQAGELMMRFADRTGLTKETPERRYLWTDAFAVCNFLALDRLDLAIRLIDRVHLALGRNRAKTKWLSELDDANAREHPTKGGLRIGKPLDERGPKD